MKNNSRTKAALINSGVATMTQIINLILNFVSRTFFIKILGEQILGLNGLFVNLLNILAFTELGIGSAITFSLYLPLAKKDIPQIQALMQLYRKTFHIIALIIFVGGIGIMLFLPKMIAGSPHVGNIFLAFSLFLANSIFSYLWSYKRSIFIASQRGYVNGLNQMIFNLAMQIVQIIFLFLTESYYIYLIIQILFTVASNLQISKLANRDFSYLNSKVHMRVDSKTIEYLKKNILGMVSSKIGGVVVFGTDNIIISSFIGLAAVGRFSNYTLVLNGVNAIIGQLVNAVTPSIGNFKIEKNKTEQVNLFYQYTQLNAYIVLFSAVVLSLLFPSFIRIWIGTEYQLSNSLTTIIVLGFFINGLRNSNLNFMNAYGTFWEMRYKSIWEAILNLFLSLILIRYTNLGIGAVVLGTVGANLLINAWWEPLIVLKYGIKISELKYIKLYLVLLISGSCLILVSQVLGNYLLNFDFIIATIIAIVTSAVLLVIYHVVLIIFYPNNYEPIRFSTIAIKVLRR